MARKKKTAPPAAAKTDKEEQHFLDLIQADADDHAGRLVYADWLEERGDDRAELIRVLEEMRTVPIHGDRFWKLKSRRNELREKCDEAWFAQLRYGINYEPVFREVPDGWKERWRLLREFTERTHGIELGDVGRDSKNVQDAESKLKMKLPPSVKEWLAYCDEMFASPNFRGIPRDCPGIQDLPDLSAISIMIAGEGDFHWAVKRENWNQPDPPVDMYASGDLYGQAEHTFVHERHMAPTVTGFVFKYLCVCPEWYEFKSRDPAPKELLQQLAAEFPVSARFDDLQIFETRNMMVVAGEIYGRHLRVLTDKIPASKLPKCFQKFAREQKWK